MNIKKFNDLVNNNKEFAEKFYEKFLNLSEKKIFFLLKEEKLYNLLFEKFNFEKSHSYATDLIKTLDNIKAQNNTIIDGDLNMELYNFQKFIFEGIKYKIIMFANRFLKLPIQNSDDLDNYAIYSNYKTFMLPIYLDRFKKLHFRLNFCVSFVVFCDQKDYSKTYIKYRCETDLNQLSAGEFSKKFQDTYPKYSPRSTGNLETIEMLLDFFQNRVSIDVVVKAEQIKNLKTIYYFVNKYNSYIGVKLKINNVVNEILKDFVLLIKSLS